jgi:hypothetical protein
VRSSSVVVLGILGEDRPQVAFTEDQHAVGDLGPGCEDEPFGVGVRPRAPGRNLHGLDAGAGQDRVERFGELPAWFQGLLGDTITIFTGVGAGP